MKTNSPVEQPDCRALADALLRGALDQADSLLANLPIPWPVEVQLLAVELHVRQHRWNPALECVARVSDDIQVGPRLAQLDAGLKAEIEQHYRGLRAEELAEVLSTDRPRKPRVLVLSCGSSDEIASEAAEAFAQIGCEPRLLVLPKSASLGSLAVRIAMDGFHPDLVLQVDQLRNNHPSLFPRQLPFASWMLSANDAVHESATELGTRDFVLCAQPSQLIHQYGYSRSQMIHMPLLARVPIRPTHWESRGDDVAYVSSNSQTTAQALDELRQYWKDAPDVAPLIEHVATELIRLYDSGGSIATHGELRTLLMASMQRTKLQIGSPEMQRRIIESVFNTLNRTLYQEQTLGWAADVANELGLTFAIYGSGWDKHPAFAAYARPAVTSSPRLDDLVRSTRVNLHVEPYALLTRGRLLAGLFAGGFFLVRDHPFNRLTQELMNCLAQCGCASAETKPQALAMVDPELRPRLEEMFEHCGVIDEQGDCVELVRDFERSRILVAGEETLPRMNEIVFNSRAMLKRCIQHFLANEDARHQIVYEQRLSTENRLSYATGLRRLLREMSQHIAAEAATPEIRKCA